MLSDILIVLWVFAPVGFANMAPVIASKISNLHKYNQPLDFGKKYRGVRVFGDHKTIRGILAGIFLGSLIGLIQFILTIFLSWEINTMLDYNNPTVIAFGALLGFGALFGDALESFFKRQLKIAPGKSWFPFDQTDYLLGGLLASMMVVQLTTQQYVIFFVIGFLIHPLFNLLSWAVGLQDHPF